MILEKPINILVRRRAAIGDVIMSTVVVRELKHRYGANCMIDIATDFIDIFRNSPHVRNIYPVDAAPDTNKYDLFVNLDDAYELNPTQHYVNNYVYRALGTVDVNKQVELFCDDTDCAQVDADLEILGRPFVVVHMRNWHWASKNMKFEVWLQIFEKIFHHTTDMTVVCVGGKTDHALHNAPLFYDFRDRYNSQQIAYLISQAECFVGTDSGPFHCAAATDTHMVALLTHLRPERILPYRHGQLGWNCTAIQTLEDCAGCNDDQIRPVRQLVCKKETFPCAGNWNVDQIAQAILAQL